MSQGHYSGFDVMAEKENWELPKQKQFEFIQEFISQNPKMDVDGIRIKAKDFLTAIHTEAVSAYYLMVSPRQSAFPLKSIDSKEYAYGIV